MLNTLVWPPFLAQMKPAERHLTLALFASTLLHAITLSMSFRFPDADRHTMESTLDIILVNSKSARKPDNAQARAQTNLDGGGNTDDDRRARTPMIAAPTTVDGSDLIDAQRRVTTLEMEQQQFITQFKSTRSVLNNSRRSEPLPPTTPALSGIDLADRALAIAKLEAQIDKQTDDYNKRPRKKFIGVRAIGVSEAQYLEDWRQKIERIGNLNYPEAAKGKLYGNLSVYVEIKSNGELDHAEIRRSSGYKILDEAALRIVALSAPFGEFPPELKRESDIIGFARTWSFTRDDELKSSAQ